MKLSWKYGLISMACVALAGCGQGGGKAEPTGQVVATVDGDEITMLELRAELEGASFPNAKARKAAEQQALQMIINRKIIAKAATEQKVDETPEFALQEQRALEALRAQALQQKILKAVPAPTKEEATRFMAAHPDIFSERKIYAVNQIRIARPTDPALMADFQPLKTLAEVEALLKSKGINYQRGTDRLDAVGTNMNLIEAIAKLPPGEVFVLPMGQLVLISEVKDTQVVPFTGERAAKYALSMVEQQRKQEALSRQMAGLLKQGASTVKYNKAYQPPKPAKPPAKGAAPASTPKA